MEHLVPELRVRILASRHVMTDNSTAMATVRVCACSIIVSVLPRRLGASSGSLVLRWNDIRHCQSIDTRKIGWLHGIHPTVGGSVVSSSKAEQTISIQSKHS